MDFVRYMYNLILITQIFNAHYNMLNNIDDLASLFQTISLSDVLYFSKLDDKATCDKLICSDKTLTVDKNNLVIKALDLMRSKTNLNQYFKVYLQKVVPMQAGLGLLHDIQNIAYIKI